MLTSETQARHRQIHTGSLESVIPGYDPAYIPPSRLIQVCNPRTSCNVHRQRLEVPSMKWVPYSPGRECPNCGAVIVGLNAYQIHIEYCNMEIKIVD